MQNLLFNIDERHAEGGQVQAIVVPPVAETTRHIIALSGGKDSTAMALRLAKVEPRDYEYVITPTGDELPEMIEH